MMKDMGSLMKQAKQMQGQLKKVQKELEKELVTGSAGGGLVEVTMTGSQKCIELKLDPDKIQEMSADRLQTLVLQAVNDALEKSRKLMAKKMGPISGGLGGLGGLKF
ncbi:MAG: YbaB/EbfC family nucleoid-associated protein [Pelolinea sp.]|nr:YbaB/EbfC family nucleoid-associated protein [Pelolinea sp.]